MSSLEIENGSLYLFQAWDYVKGEYSRKFYLDKDPEYEKIITALEGYFVKPHENIDINEGGVQKIGEFIKHRLNEYELDTKKIEPLSSASIPIIIPKYLVQDIDDYDDFKKAEIIYKVLKKNKEI